MIRGGDGRETDAGISRLFRVCLPALPGLAGGPERRPVDRLETLPGLRSAAASSRTRREVSYSLAIIRAHSRGTPSRWRGRIGRSPVSTTIRTVRPIARIAASRLVLVSKVTHNRARLIAFRAFGRFPRAKPASPGGSQSHLLDPISSLDATDTQALNGFALASELPGPESRIVGRPTPVL